MRPWVGQECRPFLQWRASDGMIMRTSRPGTGAFFRTHRRGQPGVFCAGSREQPAQTQDIVFDEKEPES